MKKFNLLIIILLLFCSCHEDYFSLIRMQDGTTIKVPTKNRFYRSEDEFIYSLSPHFPKDYDFSSIEPINYSIDSIYAVSGYNQLFIDNWEIAFFGEWIKSYDLEPYKPYYVATKVFVKYLSELPKGLKATPRRGGEHMGYIPNNLQRTFTAVRDTSHHCLILTTSIRYIGYNSDRIKTDINIPSFINNDSTNLIWDFIIREDGWY